MLRGLLLHLRKFIRYPMKQHQDDISELKIQQITERANQAHLFDATSPFLEFLVREPVLQV